MRIKRIFSTVIGFPVVATLFIFGNKFIIDILLSIVAIICVYEYNKAFKNKYKPIEYIQYIFAIGLAFIHIIPQRLIIMAVFFSIPIVIVLAFIQSLIQNTKCNVVDIAITLLGIFYTTGLITFLSLIYSSENGKILLWYALISAWGSDTFAYLIGKKYGKHKLCKISPNKTIEGSIAGIIGATLINVVYTIFMNGFLSLNINLLYILGIGIVLSIMGQVGDLAASSIKRFNGVKDFSQLIPGHGGMLDRIDSILFIAPFAYLFLVIFL